MAGEFIRVETFNPRLLATGEIRGKLLAAMQKEAKYIESLYKKTIATWEDPPSVNSTFSFAGGDAILFVGLEGTDEEVLKWILLDEGAVRYAKLSRDWKSKTTPGSLQSRQGQGEVTGYSQNPLGEILPRGWTAIIDQKSRGRLLGAVNKAIEEGIRLARSRGKTITT